MKKILFFSVAVLCASSIGSATTINLTCSPNPASYLGQSGGGTETCNALTLPGGATVNSITAQYIFDFQFDGFGSGTKTAAFSFDAPGTSADWSGTATTANRPITSPVFNIAPAGFATWLGGFTITDSYTGASIDVTGATFTKRITVDYTEATSTVPEPATYALLGLGLSALAFIRRK